MQFINFTFVTFISNYEEMEYTTNINYFVYFCMFLYTSWHLILISKPFLLAKMFIVGNHALFYH